jgi:hypothetical protein
MPNLESLVLLGFDKRVDAIAIVKALVVLAKSDEVRAWKQQSPWDVRLETIK